MRPTRSKTKNLAMKKLLKQIIFASVIIFMTTQSVGAKIRNGYAQDIETARISIVSLQQLLKEPNLTARQVSMLSKRIREQQDFILCYELTEKLINQLIAISPSIYTELDSLTDKNNSPVDVYVKCVRPYSSRTWASGITFMAQSEHDENQYVSKFGPNTVEVNIWIADNSVFILAHELGHVTFQVRNLSSYIKFYRKTYQFHSASGKIGHHRLDESGHASIIMENRFHADYIKFLQHGGEVENLMTHYARENRASKKKM